MAILRIKYFKDGWLHNRLLEFFNILRMIHFRYSFRSVGMQIWWLLVYSLIYPLPRIIFGEKRAQKICHSFLNIYFFPVILSLPPLLKSETIIRNLSDFEIYYEVYIYNGYFTELLKKGMNIIGIGAHGGIYTILAAEKVGEKGKVIAIEPEPNNYKLLFKNIELNNFKNVIPKNMALTDHEGIEKLYLSSSFAGHSLVFHGDNNHYINIPVTTIDKLVQELGIEKIDIIKIDAEGAEIPILKGAEKTLKDNPSIKSIVASYHYPAQVKEVCKFLEEKGFKTKVSSRDIVVTT